jgi:hypothetical protein
LLRSTFNGGRPRPADRNGFYSNAEFSAGPLVLSATVEASTNTRASVEFVSKEF